MADLKGRQNNASELRNREALIITGINRYIVGCKYARKGANNKVACGINRYIVGCKFAVCCSKEMNVERINRYIVGCKWI